MQISLSQQYHNNMMTITNLFSLVFFALIFCSFSPLISASLPHLESDFNYKIGDIKGPENWGKLKPEWKMCGIGKLQSPINLLSGHVEELSDKGKLQTFYKPAPAVLKSRSHDVRIQWNGDGGNLTISGDDYKLLHCYWHAPAEHNMNEAKFDLELHAVHQNLKGEIAVFGQLYKIGNPDPFLSKIFNQIKLIGDKEVDLGMISLRDLKLGGRRYYRYVGSLTTPPCTEGVIWTIGKKIRSVSVEQLNALKAAVSLGFEENSRPTQPDGGRSVWLYYHKPENSII